MIFLALNPLNRFTFILNVCFYDKTLDTNKWFSPDTRVSSIIMTDGSDITDTFLKEKF